MAFSSCFSRLRSSSKPFYGNLRHSLLNRSSSPSPQIREALISDKKRKPIFSWASSLLLPLALAVSAGSLSLHTHTNPSLCDASHVDPRYDLTRLMIGSEGTLGVITEVTLRLQKIPQYSVVAMCNFPTIKDAADVAIATMFSGIQVSRVELLDEVQVKAINIANGRNLPEVPTLMFEFEGTEAYSREQTLIVQKIATEHNGSNFIFAEDPEAKKELWRIRKEALWACFAMEPSSEAMISDVCVPLSNLAELISRSKKELDASPLVCTVVAHAGDGNFHTFILFDPSQEEQRREADRLNHFMVHTALSMEGTCTGEHGIGTGKMKYLEKELGIEALRTMKSIKAALDPNNIMNPGKLIPPHVCF